MRQPYPPWGPNAERVIADGGAESMTIGQAGSGHDAEATLTFGPAARTSSGDPEWLRECADVLLRWADDLEAERAKPAMGQSVLL